MTRQQALDAAAAHFDSGEFLATLARRVAFPTESQEADSGPALRAYLTDEIGPSLAALGFTWEVVDNPRQPYGPFLLAERIEDPGLPTVFTYGHGDVIRGYAEQWRKGRGPWLLAQEGERIYGRGTADNKGQHSINIAALASVLATRGRLGFNVKALVETGEETGSPGLAEVAAAHRQRLAADLLIASDGPRLSADRPTLFLGTRGCFNFDLTVRLREGGHHSGNWGGLIANPGTILANALACIIDGRGVIRVPELRPAPIANSVRRALAGLEVDGGSDGPSIDPDWGEPGLTPIERCFAWNSFEVLAFKTGNPERPVNAIPPVASAHCQMRFVAGSDWRQFIPALRRHLDAHGFPMVTVTATMDEAMAATRLDPDHDYVRWAARSIERTAGRPPAVLPNLGGSLPNDVFADILDMPTIWVPHSYPSCSQHAPDEHMLAPVVREGLLIMTGLFWDLGEPAGAEGALPVLAA
ncbi:MAG: M20 family metallopeptidase [Thalassobaculales bacterium]